MITNFFIYFSILQKMMIYSLHSLSTCNCQFISMKLCYGTVVNFTIFTSFSFCGHLFSSWYYVISINYCFSLNLWLWLIYLLIFFYYVSESYHAKPSQLLIPLYSVMHLVYHFQFCCCRNFEMFWIYFPYTGLEIFSILLSCTHNGFVVTHKTWVDSKALHEILIFSLL